MGVQTLYNVRVIIFPKDLACRGYIIFSTQAKGKDIYVWKLMRNYNEFIQVDELCRKLHSKESLEKVLQSIERQIIINGLFEQSFLSGCKDNLNETISSVFDFVVAGEKKKRWFKVKSSAFGVLLQKYNIPMESVPTRDAIQNILVDILSSSGVSAFLCLAEREQKILLNELENLNKKMPLLIESNIDYTEKHGETALISAVKRGNADLVELLIHYGAHPDVPGFFGNTPLIEAVTNGHKEIATLLLRGGASVDIKNEEGKTAWDHAKDDSIKKLLNKAKLNDDLLMASYEGNAERIKELLRKGADINARDRRGRTALMNASSDGNKNIVEFLLDAGAKVDMRDREGNTALLIASRNAYGDSIEENKAIIRLLIKRGADLRLKNKKGLTALDMTRDESIKDFIKEIIKNKFLKAFLDGNKDEVLEWLKYGADVNARDAQGVPALMIAVEEGNRDLVKLLLNEGAKVDEANPYGLTALMWAAIEGHVDIVQSLLDAGADVNKKSFDRGETVLMWAARYGSLPIVEILLKKGALVDEKDNDGKTALLYAVEEGDNPDIVKVLIDEGADVNIKYLDGRSLLITAGALNKEAIMKQLLEREDIDVNVVTSNGVTALMWSAYQGYPDVMKTLLEKGADLNATDDQGKTALDYARLGDSENKEFIIEYLEAYDSSETAEEEVFEESVVSSEPRRESIAEEPQEEIELVCEGPVPEKDFDKDLFEAIANDDDEIINKQIEEGVDTCLDKDGKTLLIYAAIAGNNKLVKYLIHEGAQVNIESKEKRTALMLAAYNGHEEVVSELLKHGAKPKINDQNYRGATPLIYASSAGHKNVVD